MNLQVIAQPKAASLQFTSLITKISTAYDPEFWTREFSHMRLEFAPESPFMPLVIEKPGRNLVSVAHYFVQNGDLMADPDILFCLCPRRNKQGKDITRWIPMEITQHPIGRYMQAAWFNDENRLGFNAHAVADIATFCFHWGKNIRLAGWLLPDGKTNPEVSCKL